MIPYGAQSLIGHGRPFWRVNLLDSPSNAGLVDEISPERWPHLPASCCPPIPFRGRQNIFPRRVGANVHMPLFRLCIPCKSSPSPARPPSTTFDSEPPIRRARVVHLQAGKVAQGVCPRARGRNSAVMCPSPAELVEPLFGLLRRPLVEALVTFAGPSTTTPTLS